MIGFEDFEAIGLIVVCFLMTLILIRILFYVHKQADQVEQIRKQIELMNEKEGNEKNDG